MRKIILLFVAIGFITMAATPTSSVSTDGAALKNKLKHERYKSSIRACNMCIAACEKVIDICCANEQNPEMENCRKLAELCIAECKVTIIYMSTNNEMVKSKCLECVKVCEECAAECDNFNIAEFKECAINCRETALYAYLHLL
jgi:hypothetical protein